MASDDTPKNLVFDQSVDILRKRIQHVTSKLKTRAQLDKVVRKYPVEQPMSEFDKSAQHVLNVLEAMNKKAFVPAQAVMAPPMDPAMAGGAPMDPAMAAGGAPMDPSMMAPQGQPMDPAMAQQQPPMDPAMAGGAPADPSQMDPAMMQAMMAQAGAPAPAAPAAPAPEASAEPARPATVSDISVLEERMAGYESLLKDIIKAIDSLGSVSSGRADAKAVKGEPGAANAPEADSMGSPASSIVMPGPYGANASNAMAAIRSNPGGNPDKLMNLLGRLNEVKVG